MQMVMPFKGDAVRHDMRPLRNNARHCQMADEVITAQTVKFVALEWNPSTNSVAVQDMDITLADVRSIALAEPSGSKPHPDRSAIARFRDGQ